MRILIAAVGSHGDVLPFVGLGKALTQRGHEVIVYGNALYGELARAAGLVHIDTTDAQPALDVLADPRATETQAGLRLVAAGVVASVAPTLQAMRQGVRAITASISLRFDQDTLDSLQLLEPAS